MDPAAAARALPALVLALAACASPPGVPEQGPPALLVSDRSGAFRVYEEIEKDAARLLGEARGGGAHSDSMPARLPGGGVVFVSDRDGNPEIYLAAGGATRRLTFDAPGRPAEDSAPAPLGRDRIVFARSEPDALSGAPRDLYSMRLDGSDLRRLTRHPADDAEPWGSDDGRAVAFVSDRSGDRRIHLLPDAGAVDPEAADVCLTGCGPPGDPAGPAARAVVDRAPVFLPDGAVVFGRGPAGGPSHLFVMDRAGAAAGVRQITDSDTLPYGAAEPIVLDGRTILLVTGPVPGREKRSGGGRYVVYRIALGGFNLARITRDQAPYSEFTRRLAGP